MLSTVKYRLPEEPWSALPDHQVGPPNDGLLHLRLSAPRSSHGLSFRGSTSHFANRAMGVGHTSSHFFEEEIMDLYESL